MVGASSQVATAPCSPTKLLPTCSKARPETPTRGKDVTREIIYLQNPPRHQKVELVLYVLWCTVTCGHGALRNLQSAIHQSTHWIPQKFDVHWGGKQVDGMRLQRRRDTWNSAVSCLVRLPSLSHYSAQGSPSSHRGHPPSQE